MSQKVSESDRWSEERSCSIANDDESFPKSARLLKRKDFRRTERRGRRARGRHFVVYARPNGFDFSRLGLTVSRKVGNAVRRNRWKRRIREVFRRNKGPWPTGYDFVVIVRSYKPKDGRKPSHPTFEAIKLELIDLANEAVKPKDES